MYTPVIYDVDTETTGIGHGYRPERLTTVGISQYAIIGPNKVVGGHTDILQQALSQKRTAAEYHKMLTTGAIQWQSGYAQEHDVLAGVFERHVAATKAGRAIHTEQQAVLDIAETLKRGDAIRLWNARFDIDQYKSTARKLGIAGFDDLITEAHASGRVIEASEPIQRFLFNWAQQGKITFSQSAKSAKKMINLGEWTAKDIDTVPLNQLFEENVGFKELFKQRPNISYKQYVEDILEGDAALTFQSFGMGQQKPNVRFMRGWKLSLIADMINPGFSTDPGKTLLGQEIARRKIARGLVSAATAHDATDDAILSGMLYDAFNVDDTRGVIANLKGYGVESEEQLLGNYKPAWGKDLRQYLKTYLGDRNPKQVDTNYLKRVIGGVQMQAAAPEVANLSATTTSKLPGLKSIYMDALKEAQEMATKYPKRTAIAGIVGGILLADAFIPETNRLEGRRHPDSKYTRIRGITFEGINSPEGTDFGSGRAIDNPSALLSYRMSQSNATNTYQGYSIAELESAQMTWGSAFGQTAKALLDPSEYKIVPGRKINMPGVSQDAWVGVMDLKNYRVRVEDADTVSLLRRGMLHLFDKPIEVRLAGIDAAETEHAVAGRGLSIPAKQPSGLESTKYLKQLLEHQKNMRLLLDPSRTTYGRHVGILSGSSTPNINLKLVGAGAAAALPYDEEGNIASYRAYEKAEAQAATSGIGMWASKGWQAKRMMDLTLGSRITNTSLTQMDRLATRAGLAEYYSLVQNLHQSKPKDPWMSEDVLSMQYLLSGMSITDLTANATKRIKDYGWQRGIRDGASQYNTAGSGINPSGINVSAFGSGWSRAGMERVLRLTDPIRVGAKKIQHFLGSLLKPPADRRRTINIALRTADRVQAGRLLKQQVDTTPIPVRTPYKSATPNIVPVGVSRGMKVGIGDAVDGSSAYTSVMMARSHKSGWRRSKYLGAIYSSQMALGKPGPLNKYVAVVGPGFPGAWQDKAWKNFDNGNLWIDRAQAGYDELSENLRKAGIKNPESFLKRRGIAGKLEYITDRVPYQKAIAANRYTGVVSNWGAFVNVGKAIWHHEPAYLAASGNFLANRNEIYKNTSFRQLWKEEFGLTSALWKSNVTGKTGFWGKTAGFIDFLSADSLDPHISKHWLKRRKTPGVSDASPKNWAGKAAESAKGWGKTQLDSLKYHFYSPDTQKITGAAKAWATKNTPAVLKSVGKFGARRIGLFGAGFSLISAFSSAPEYKNQAAGFGLEVAAAGIETGVGFAAWSLTSAAAAAAGGKIGAAIGAGIGTLFGLAPGAAAGGIIGGAAGAVIGFGINFVVSTVASMVVGTAVREAGGLVFKKRNAEPNLQDPTYGPNIPGTNQYGAMDEYLMAGHGIQGRPEFSGFGGGLKIQIEKMALADTLGRASAKIVGSSLPPRAPTLYRRPSRFTPTAGLVNNVLWNNRHTAYKQMRNHAHRSPNNSRMLMAA